MSTLYLSVSILEKGKLYAAEILEVNKNLLAIDKKELYIPNRAFVFQLHLCEKYVVIYVFQEWLSLTGSCHIPDLRSGVLGVNNEIEHSRALNTIMLLVKSFIMNCKYDKCVLSTASLARIFKQKKTLLSIVFDQNVFVQLAMTF